MYNAELYMCGYFQLPLALLQRHPLLQPRSNSPYPDYLNVEWLCSSLHNGYAPACRKAVLILA